MSAPQILVRLTPDTDPVPLRDLSWEYVAPCGCTCGVMVPEETDHDTAYRRFIPNAEYRARDVKRGFVFRLVPRGDAIDRMRGRCQHEPRFGVDRAPIPAEHRWAYASGRRTHLVPVPDDADKYQFQVWAAPLCGGQRDLYGFGWDDRPECTRCDRKARELAGGAA